MMLMMSSISGLLDPEAGMAQTLAHFYKWYCGCKSDQWEPLSEQHDHPQTAQWRGVWLLQWPDDPGEGQASQRQVTDLIYCITYVEQIVDVRSYIWVLNTERRRNIVHCWFWVFYFQSNQAQLEISYFFWCCAFSSFHCIFRSVILHSKTCRLYCNLYAFVYWWFPQKSCVDVRLHLLLTKCSNYPRRRLGRLWTLTSWVRLHFNWF